MNILEFDCVFDLAETLQAMLGDATDDYPVISVYGKYEIIKPLLENLIMSGIEIANEIELEEYAVTHYDKEFVLYLSDRGINVEKTYRDGGYLYGVGNISFVHDDCSSKLLPYVNSNIIYEFNIDEQEIDVDLDSEFELEFDCDEDCENCPMCDDNPRDNYTITIKTNVDADEVMKAIEEMERRIIKMCDSFFNNMMRDNFFRYR